MKQRFMRGLTTLVVTAPILYSFPLTHVFASTPTSSFQSPSTFSTSSYDIPQAIITADFNNDGKSDIATVGRTYIYVLLGNGNGSFSSSAISSPWHPTQFNERVGGATVADLNDDGNQDIVVGDGTSGYEYVALGNGNGSFGDGSGNNYSYTGGGLVGSLTTADFNKDGHIDVADVSTNGLEVSYGNGDGSFYTNSSYSGSDYRFVSVADFNEDGWQDVAVGDAFTHKVSVFINNEHGILGSATQYNEGGSASESGIAVGDLNNDGHLDVAIANSDNNTISVLSGIGDGSLSSPVAISAGNGPGILAMGDFNGDGYSDLATVDDNDGNTATIAILDNHANGSIGFSLDDNLNLPGQAGPLLAAEFNNDGKPDIAGLDYYLDGSSQTSVSTFLNNTVLDATAPIVSNVSFNINPKSVTQTADILSAQVSDDSSGVSSVEYYDPIQATWQPMTLNASTASVTVNTNALTYPAGMYAFQIRATDVAGNVSAPIKAYLDVYDPSAGYAAGSGSITPNGSTSNPGDILPTEAGQNIKARFDFTVKYDGLNSTVPTGSSIFSWGSTCNNPHSNCFGMTTNSLSWLIVQSSSSTAVFQGLAALNQGGNSLGSNYPVRVTAFSGTPANAASHYLLQIFAIGGNPDTDAPLYQASGDLTGGQIVLHQ